MADEKKFAEVMSRLARVKASEFPKPRPPKQAPAISARAKTNAKDEKK